MAKIHSLNIGGSTYVIEPKTVKINDVRGEDRLTSYFADYALTPWFNQNSDVNEEHWASGITMKGWSNDYQSWQLAAGSSDFLQSGSKFRNGLNDTWEPWKSVILEGDTATSSYSIYVTYNPLSNDTYSVPFMDAGHSKNSKIYSDDTFYYNPYRNILTAAYFDGIATRVNATPRQVGISYLAFLDNKTLGGRYIYSYAHAFMDATNGEMQIPNLRLKHTDNNYSSYLRFGDGNYSYICETPADRLIYYARQHTIRSNRSEGIHLDGFTYLMSNVEPKRNNTSDLGSSSKKFKAAYSTTFYGNLIGNVIGDFVGNVTMNAESASQVNVTATETTGNYPLILGPAANAGSTIDTGNKSLYTDSENSLYYNPSNNTLYSTKFSGNLTGNVIGNSDSSTTIKVNVTSTSGNYPLILGPSTIVGGPVKMGNKSLYTDSENNLYYNPSTNTLFASYFSGEAAKVKVRATASFANYPLIFGPSVATVGGTVSTGSKS